MRMLQFVLLVAALLFARTAAAQVYEFPRYDDAAQVRADCDRLLVDLKQRERAIAALPERGGDVLAALDALNQRVEDLMGPLSVVPAVHPAKPVRDAAEACDLAYQRFNNAFLQNAEVYARLKQAEVADDDLAVVDPDLDLDLDVDDDGDSPDNEVDLGGDDDLGLEAGDGEGDDDN